MAIYLSRKKGGTVATPITPSNSSPAQMTANTPVNPTGNGYAIESYSSITPSNSSPVALTSGDIVKLGGNGYAISSYNLIRPSMYIDSVYEDGIYKMEDDGYIVKEITSILPDNTGTNRLMYGSTYYATGDGYAIESYDNITPSNSSPITLTNGDIIKVSGNGKAVSSITEITPSGDAMGFQSNSIVKFDGFGYVINTYTSVSPSNSSPVTLSDGEYYKMSGAGKAVASVTNKTPSDSSPASVSSGAIIKASASGYLYASSGLGKCKAGTFTSSTSSQTINLGFQPKYLLVMTDGRTSNIYDVSYSSTQAVYAATNAYSTNYTISGNSSNNHISAISSTGFTYNKSGSAGSTIYYFAVG